MYHFHPGEAEGSAWALLPSSLWIPAQGMAPPTMGRPSHSNYPNQDNPPLACPEATSQMTLDLIKLTIEINYNGMAMP